MNSQTGKPIIIQSADGSRTITLTNEDLNEYKKCLDDKKLPSAIISIVGGLLTALRGKVNAQNPMAYYCGKGIIAVTATFSYYIFATLGSGLSCASILHKIVKEKSDYLSSRPVDPEKDEQSTKESLDFTPSISSHDFSDPINFSSDTSVGISTFDKPEDSQDLRDKTAAEKKHVTYDDLWRRHQANSQAGNKASYSSERTDLGSSTQDEPSREKKKIRTNKYGDPLE